MPNFHTIKRLNSYLMIASQNILLSAPYHIYFFVTNTCNANCFHCLYKNFKSKGKDISLREIENFLKQKPKIYNLVLTGGEPLLRDDLIKIASAFINNADTQFITLPTNGSLPDKLYNFVHDIKKHYPNIDLTVQISIDGFGKNLNKIRNLNNFDLHENSIMRSMEHLDKLKKIWPDIFVQISTLITDNNFQRIDEICERIHSDFSFDYQILLMDRNDNNFLDRVDINKIYNLSNNYSSLKNISWQDIRYPFKIIRKMLLTHSLKKYYKNLKNAKNIIKCLAGRNFAVIDHSGDIYPCEILMQEKLGNCFNEDFNWNNFWKTQKVKGFRKKIKMNKCKCNWFCATSLH